MSTSQYKSYTYNKLTNTHFRYVKKQSTILITFYKKLCSLIYHNITYINLSFINVSFINKPLINMTFISVTKYEKP